MSIDLVEVKKLIESGSVVPTNIVITLFNMAVHQEMVTNESKTRPKLGRPVKYKTDEEKRVAHLIKLRESRARKKARELAKTQLQLIPLPDKS